MQKSQLSSHTDTSRVSEAMVRSAVQPAFTRTWRPYSHATILDAMASACKELQLKVIKRDYSMSPDQTKMFGVWEVSNFTNEETNLALGMRSSTNKAFAVGVCAGERVFVCDNMAFSSDFILFRKHSGQLTPEELFLIAREAVRMALKQFESLAAWHQSLKEIRLENTQAAFLILAAMRSHILPPSRFNEFNDLFYSRESKYDAGLERTMFGFHGTMTELYRENSLLSLHGQNERLNRFIEFEAPRVLTLAKENASGTEHWFLEADRIHEEAVEQHHADRAEERSANKETMADMRGRIKGELRAAAAEKVN